MRLGLLKSLVIVFALGFSAGLYAAEAPADGPSYKAQTEALIKVGDYKGAYALLEPLESEYAGDIDYDYYLGLSAVESGHLTRGVFALERVLVQQPNHQDARATLAVAHFKLGEADEAQKEFSNLKTLNLSEDAKQTVDRFMSAIDKAVGNTTSFTAYLEGTVGFDSNISSATGVNSVAVPLFGGQLFNINADFLEQESGFATLAGGAGMRMPLTKKLALLGNINGSNKFNWQTDDFDLGAVDYSLGARYKHFEHAFTVLAQDAHTYVGNDKFRRAYGVSAQWQYDLNATNQIGAYLQQTRLAYEQNQSIRDVDRTVVGANYAHVFSGDLTPVVYSSMYLGEENERADNVPYLGHDLYGVRLGGQITVKPKLVLYANAAYENRDFGGRDVFFLKSREDNQYELSIGARYLPAQYWVVRPQISYTDTQSNIVLNEFDRLVASISIRRDFNW